jgi:pimeloyl-ACP methyl ester carboxylesterase
VAGYGAWVDEVLLAVRTTHPASRVVLAGHSRGAAVALSASPELADALVLLSPAGLTAVRPTAAMLRATLPWLVGRRDAGSRRLVEYLSAPGFAPPPALVEWLTLVARATRTTGAPGPLPAAVLDRWRGGDVRVAVGAADCFFPPGPLAAAVESRLGVGVTVVPGAGHLLVDEQPAAVARLVDEAS